MINSLKACVGLAKFKKIIIFHLKMGLLFIQFSDTAIVGLVCFCAKIIHNALGEDKKRCF